MLLRTFLALLVVTGTAAPQPCPAKSPEKQDAPLTISSFSASGLQHEDDLTNFFVGNFADVPYDRGSVTFSALFQQYLEAYARQCGDSLPANNRVKMTRQVCDDPPSLPNQPSSPYRTNTCSTWRTVSLGYADPALYAAKSQLDHEQSANHVKGILELKNPLASARDVLQLTKDLDALVRHNACNGPGLRRFQENVALFSKGQPPILLAGYNHSSARHREAGTSPPRSSPAEAGLSQVLAGRRPVQPPPSATHPAVDPALLSPAPNNIAAPHAPAPTVEERQVRARKAVDCRQQAVKDHPEGGLAMTQEYTSFLQAK